MHDGRRHYLRLGKDINRTVAGELARVQRAAVLKGEAGIGLVAGVNLRAVQELGGWSSLDVVQRYAHLSGAHKADAVERIIADHSPTGFTTPTESPRAVSGKLVKSKGAPVAQVDRAAVS